jgi:hypothetical protein
VAEEHHVPRVACARSKLDVVSGLCCGFYQSVDVDEKWVFIAKEHLKLCLSHIELVEGRVPNRRAVHKLHML